MERRILFLILLSLAVSFNNLVAQKKNKKIVISGFVTDADSNPVTGAMVLIDKVNTKILTDYNGHYKVRTRSDANMITILTENNLAKSELIDGRSAINFNLGKTSDSLLTGKFQDYNEELINLGYRKMNSKNMTQSVSQLDVSGDEYSSYRNIYEMIAGKVPGVDVNGQKIRIRGINSLVSNNDPMFVVNGLPTNSIDHIQPHTVKSITILKGPATAIYGSRGSNGVIVITLKKDNN